MAKIVYIPTLELYDLRSLITEEDGNRTFKVQKLESDDFCVSEYQNFPIIVRDNGAIWADGSLYLLEFLKGIIPPNSRTLESIAGDLKSFFEWSVDSSFNYKNSTGSRYKLAPARFARYLRDSDQIAPSTAARRISNIQRFYVWMMESGRIEDREYWQTKIGYKGIGRVTNSSELVNAVRVIRVIDNDPRIILDDGKLRPLTAAEQGQLFQALKRIGNIEMLLAFLLAITTGARLSSVLTFRERHFYQEPNGEDSYVVRNIGRNTLIDNKRGVQHALAIPIWLYKAFQLYLPSQRRAKRKLASNHRYNDPGDEYFFLTTRGKAYYLSKYDQNRKAYSNVPRGGSVGQFIRNQLKPALKKQDNDFKFNFHDLRATFGVNLTKHLVKSLNSESLLQENSAEFLHILEFVKNRMGHRRIETTLRYLRFTRDKDVSLDMQSSFEKYLLDFK